jgi:DNA polymerase III delta prime subunit
MYQNNDNVNGNDIINALSLLLAVANLNENREQSAHNDVQTANDKQAEYLLREINTRFEQQNEMLLEIMARLKLLEEKDN